MQAALRPSPLSVSSPARGRRGPARELDDRVEIASLRHQLPCPRDLRSPGRHAPPPAPGRDAATAARSQASRRTRPSSGTEARAKPFADEIGVPVRGDLVDDRAGDRKALRQPRAAFRDRRGASAPGPARRRRARTGRPVSAASEAVEPAPPGPPSKRPITPSTTTMSAPSACRASRARRSLRRHRPGIEVDRRRAARRFQKFRVDVVRPAFRRGDAQAARAQAPRSARARSSSCRNGSPPRRRSARACSSRRLAALRLAAQCRADRRRASRPVERAEPVERRRAAAPPRRRTTTAGGSRPLAARSAAASPSVVSSTCCASVVACETMATGSSVAAAGHDQRRGDLRRDASPPCT